MFRLLASVTEGVSRPASERERRPKHEGLEPSLQNCERACAGTAVFARTRGQRTGANPSQQLAERFFSRHSVSKDCGSDMNHGSQPGCGGIGSRFLQKAKAGA